MKIALAQIDIAFGDPQTNLTNAIGYISRASGLGADLILLPELWTTGYDLSRADTYAVPLDRGIYFELSALAMEHRIVIAGSTLSLITPKKIGNTLTVFDRDGRLAGSYSKTHLFGLMNEPDYLTAGDSLTLINLENAKTGLSICYDLRFPELFRTYSLRGAQMILIPAEWPHPRLAHWQTLLRARAIENQMYVVACNRVGKDANNTFFGHSMIIDPWGEILVEGGEGEDLLIAEIDLDKVDQVQRKIPVFKDRRPDVYSL